MSSKPYLFTFTTGTLQPIQSILIANKYAELENWDDVRKQVKELNLLQGKTRSSTARRANEVISRLSLLDDSQLQTLSRVGYKNQLYILWLAMCRRYRFIGDFFTEVVTPKTLSPEKAVTIFDYQVYFEQKAMLFPYMEKLKDSTKKKAANSIFVTARQANLLDRENNLLPIIVIPEVNQFFSNLSLKERQYFPGLFI